MVGWCKSMEIASKRLVSRRWNEYYRKNDSSFLFIAGLHCAFYFTYCSVLIIARICFPNMKNEKSTILVSSKKKKFICAKKGGRYVIQYFVHWLRYFSSFFRSQLKFSRNQVIAVSRLQVQCAWQLFSFMSASLVSICLLLTPLHFPILLKLMNIWDYFPHFFYPTSIVRKIDIPRAT